MPKIRMLVVSLIVIATVLMTACTPTPAATTPAPQDTATTAVQPTAEVPPTVAPTAETPATPVPPTAEPTKETGGLPKVTGEVTLWHSYHTGGAEEQAMTQLIAAAQKDNPDAKINVLAIPFDQIFNKWETEVAAGGGPDMFIAPNDNLGKEARANLLLAIDDKMAPYLAAYSDVSVAGMKVDGKLYAVPESLKAVALAYNKSKVPTPPATTDELLAMVKAGKIIELNQNAYHNFGFFGAFGGKLADDSGKCIADQGGFADALQYLVDLKAAGAKFETDGGKADAAFRQGQADMIINGPWVLGDYKTDLKDNLGIAPMPAGPKGNASPLTGVDGFYINPNSANVDGAIALGLYLTQKSSEQVFVDVAGHVPAAKGVEVKDPLVKGFTDAALNGFPRPQGAWFDNYWGPFGDMLTKVLEGQAKPADGVKQACADMNKANGK